MNKEKEKDLQDKCNQFRNELIDLLYEIQTGHPGGSLSITEILTVLYYDKMNIDPQNPKMEDRDRLILSKGHGAPMLYLILGDLGYFPKDELKTLRQINSNLQGHPCAHKTCGVELSTGPLGLGLGAGLGMVLSDRLDKKDSYTYVILGDGECQEGAIWEAALAASKYKTNHLIAILDDNGVQLDGITDDIMPMGDLHCKWAAFGWNVIPCDGHNIVSISQAIEEAKKNKKAPTIIIAKTVKGKGISFMEGENIWHGKPINPDEYKAAKAELGGGLI